MRRKIFILAFIAALLALNAVAASGCRAGPPAQPEGLDVIRAMGEKREIRASARLRGDAAERVYYVASGEDRDVFCVLARRDGGAWALEAEAGGLLPRGIAERPHIDFENEQRVYLTYYPEDKPSASLFLYGFTLLARGGQWYVEGVSFGGLDAEARVFHATAVNLAGKNTSVYAFDLTTEEILSSREIPNNLRMVKADDFSLEDFMKSVEAGP